MPLTQEELTAITAALTGEEVEHEALKPLKDAGLIIRTPKGEETFRTNYLNTEFSKRDATAYTNIEKHVKELTGIEKESNEKASDYFVRALSKDKEARTGLQTELDTLREEKKAGFGSADASKRIEQLEKLLQTTKETHLKELTDKETEKLQIRVEAQLDTALNGIKGNLKKSIDPAVVEDVLEARMLKFNKQYSPKVTDKGAIVFVDKDGEVINNPDTFKPRTAKELVADFFKDLVEPKHEQGGAGSGKPAPEPRQPGQPVPAPPAAIDTQVKLTTYLKEQGLATGTKEFDEAFEKYKGEKPLR